MNARTGFTAAQITVLDHLKQTGRSSAKQIAAALEVTPASIRNHLTTLEKAGLVSFTLRREGKGRPLHVYALTEEARTVFPDDYEGFIVSFLRSAVEVLGEVKLQTVFKRMLRHAKARYAPRMSDKDLETRVAEMTRILSDSGYMAESRRIGKDAFELTEHNCPIWQVATEYPDVCACELSLIRELLGASVERKEHIVAGDAVCSYRIRVSPRTGKKGGHQPA